MDAFRWMLLEHTDLLPLLFSRRFPGGGGCPSIAHLHEMLSRQPPEETFESSLRWLINGNIQDTVTDTTTD